MPAPPNELIVAISSAAGAAAIGVVRLSGDGAVEALEKLVDGPLKTPRRPALRTLLDPDDGRPLDRAVVWFMRAPATYTGEDMAEVHAHGNPVVLDGIVDACVRLGARPAGPGEFTRRALLNDKLDLAEAEAVLAAVDAETLAGARMAARVLDGDLQRAVGALRGHMLIVAATLEASLDYGDDVGDVVDAGVVEQVASLARELARLAGGVTAAGRLVTGADVAILGPTNAGKSTLLNRILGQERAIVHEDPGTTRDVVTGERDLAGIRVRFHDTAGLREAGEPVEDEGIRRARALRGRASVVLFVRDSCADGGPGPEPGDVVVDNKVDLRPGNAGGGDGFPVSALTGQGVEALLSHLGERLRGGDDVQGESVLWTVRQGEAARRAAEHMEGARRSLLSGEHGPAALEIGDALRALEGLLGIDPVEAVLDELFARFCVGK